MKTEQPIPSLEQMIAMPLHTCEKLNSDETIMRVPGGWIYEYCRTVGDNFKNQYTTTFVPEPSVK